MRHISEMNPSQKVWYTGTGVVIAIMAFIVVGLLFGWVSFGAGSNEESVSLTMNVNTKEIAQDASEVVAGAESAIATETLKGTLVSVHENSLVVQQEGKEPVELQVVDTTQVFVNGEEAKLTNLRENGEVTAIYQEIEGKNQAKEITQPRETDS